MEYLWEIEIENDRCILMEGKENTNKNRFY